MCVTTTIIYYMLEIESCFKRVCIYQERQTIVSQLYNFHPIKLVISKKVHLLNWMDIQVFK